MLAHKLVLFLRTRPPPEWEPRPHGCDLPLRHVAGRFLEHETAVRPPDGEDNAEAKQEAKYGYEPPVVRHLP